MTSLLVLYKLTAQDAEQVNRRRGDFAAFSQKHHSPAAEPGSFPGRSGHIGHYGNPAQAGDVLPAVITHDYGGSANLHILLDGNDTLWVTSRAQGDQPGQWQPAPAAASPVLPQLGSTVHYVSHGTPHRADGSQAYASQCRAAIVSETPGADGALTLFVINPAGQFYSPAIPYDAGTGTPADSGCKGLHENGPHRYCGCGWTEAAYRGGTWHPAGHQ